MLFHRHATCAALIVLATPLAGAQSLDALKGAAAKAVAGNPEVAARFNSWRASTDAIDVARASYLPRLDLNASVGQDSDRIDTRNPESQTLTRNGFGLTLSQLLWDGLGTRNDVARLGHDSLSRYFELLDVTEQIALEAARSHYDVQRYRRLVELAEDSYVQHRYAFTQIQSRVKAGVGRGVDLEQAGARLALAESNLTTEAANLHDVTVRYQRIVGELPPNSLPGLAVLKPQAPASASEASALAVGQSAAVSAAIENLRGARALAQVRHAAWQPRIDARVRSTAGHNVDGVRDQTRNSAAEIVLNWNLFNGGADQARVRQQANAVNQAADLRDKACRDTRQTVAIAFNDTRKLAEQLVYLDRNTLAIEKARDAYRQQFDIGQRSLLDLLNAENELYTAKRAYANAEHDHALAYARLHAAMNQLGAQLGVARLDGETSQAAGWRAGDDAPSRCPQAVVELPTSDRTALDARAARIAPTPAPR